jgi:amino acid transporter
MKKQIAHFSLHQTAKILCLVPFVITAVFAIPMGIFTFFSGDKESAFQLFLMPFLIAAFSYVGYVLWGWLYNLLAKRFGGIEFELTDKD